jgi:hypothetical protein
MQPSYPRKRRMVERMKPPLILPMDSRLLPRSRARVDAAQTHRSTEFLPARPQRIASMGRHGFDPMRHANTQRNVFPGRWVLVRLLTLPASIWLKTAGLSVPNSGA